MNVLALVLLSVISATPAPAPREWRDNIRDVYVDGKLDRSAQTLTTSSPRMIAVVCGEEVLLLDPEKQTVARSAKSNFKFAPDRTSATTAPELTGDTAGELTDAAGALTDAAGALTHAGGSTYLARIGGKTVLLTSHQSKPGPMTIEELWATAPVWRAIADHYQPDGAIVERLRAIDQPVTLDVVLATWCGDSRQHVPRLLKSIAAAANPNISVQLLGIDSEFQKPVDVVAGKNITNVPTVIVRSGEREVGRFVETPAAATVEDDVCDIVAGTPKPHRGRIERGALRASGTYLLRDARRRQVGTETFELYEKPGGGTVAHSLIAKRDGTTIETWATPTFIEVTTRDGKMTRTRIRRDGETWALHSRGTTGIIDQAIAAPAAFVTPATITYAWARDAASAYVVPERGTGAVAPLNVRVGEGAVPRFVRFADGSSRVLVR